MNTEILFTPFLSFDQFPTDDYTFIDEPVSEYLYNFVEDLLYDIANVYNV